MAPREESHPCAGLRLDGPRSDSPPRTSEAEVALFDLSHSIYTGMTTIPLLPRVEVRPVSALDRGAAVNVAELTMATHAGTHVDAPAHVIRNGRTIDQIPLERWRGPAIVVPISHHSAQAIPVTDLAAADIRPGDIVLLATGWDAHFAKSAYQLHPYLSEDAAGWLVDRGVSMVGIDTLNVEMPIERRPPGFTLPVHHLLLEHEVLIIENLKDLLRLRGRRIRLQAFPLNIRGGDGAPARVVAESEGD